MEGVVLPQFGMLSAGQQAPDALAKVQVVVADALVLDHGVQQGGLVLGRTLWLRYAACMQLLCNMANNSVSVSCSDPLVLDHDLQQGGWYWDARFGSAMPPASSSCRTRQTTFSAVIKIQRAYVNHCRDALQLGP